MLHYKVNSTIHQVFSVLNHVGVCVSYQAAWDYLRQLTAEAGYQEAVTVGHWLWVYDNLNIHQPVRHEREGKQHTLTYQFTRVTDYF